MTLQDDLARPWFQPLVPTDDAPQHHTRAGAGPLTTRIEGEIVPPEPPRTPAHPAPEQLEVTQPYIPAIREHPPEFAKRLNPDTVGAAPLHTPEPPARSAAEGPTRSTGPAESTGPPQPATRVGPAGTTAPTEAAPQHPTGVATTPATSAAPAPRRSLARRVVRRILGPDLLRKDPAPKRR